MEITGSQHTIESNVGSKSCIRSNVQQARVSVTSWRWWHVGHLQAWLRVCQLTIWGGLEQHLSRNSDVRFVAALSSPTWPFKMSINQSIREWHGFAPSQVSNRLWKPGLGSRWASRSLVTLVDLFRERLGTASRSGIHFVYNSILGCYAALSMGVHYSIYLQWYLPSWR